MANDNVKYVTLVLMIVAVVIALISFFSNWFTIEIMGFKGSATGKDLLDNAEGTFQMFAPLIILIVSIVALIVAALPHIGVEMPSKTLTIFITVLGIIAIIMFIVYFTYSETNGGFTLKTSDYMDSGAWMGLISGIVILLTGGLRFFGVIGDDESSPSPAPSPVQNNVDVAAPVDNVESNVENKVEEQQDLNQDKPQ